MNFYLNKWLNYGVDANADIEEVKRIKIYNAFLTGQIAIILIAVPIMIFNNFEVKKYLCLHTWAY